tara:strand:- start:708 stop:3644 length:2937 start_codon:yes stop_codon:yes gene_type:complete
MYLGDPTKLNDALVFVNNPPAAEATLINEWPFTIFMSAGDTGDHYIDLYSQYSRSRPYQVPQGKWTHLLPQWRFLDLNGNYIDKIKTTDTIITDASGNVIGVTASEQFYYIDDMPSITYSSPVMLWATMEVSGRPVDYDIQGSPLPGYANSKVIKGEPYYINGQAPAYLDITRNGVDDISQLKWVDNTFRYSVVAKSSAAEMDCESGYYTGDITVFDYPQEAISTWPATREINRDVLSTPASSETWDPKEAYFKRTDTDGHHIGGFQIGTIESTHKSLNTNISAEVDVKYYPWYRDKPYVWISNGGLQSINKVSTPWSFGEYNNPLLPTIETYSYDGGNEYFPVSSISGGSYWEGGVLENSIFGGIHGLAVAGKCSNIIWGVDSELDMLFNFSTSGNILCSVDIEPIGASPQSIAIDSNLDMWVTLFGATSSIKYDSTGTLTTAVAVPPYEILDLFPLTGSDPDEIRVRPVQVDTDSSDNIWVTYEHPVSSMALKYDTNGTFITALNLPLSCQPQGVVVDPFDGSVWISETYEQLLDPYTWQYAASGGTIQHFTSAGALTESFYDIAHPGYLALDFNQTLWFTFGVAGVGSISGGSVEKYWASDGEVVTYGADQIAIDNSSIGLNDRIKGIGVDWRHRVWALNSNENKAYIINPINAPESHTATIRPIDRDLVDHSIQGMGDWTGMHWSQKYNYLDPSISFERTISGLSNSFNIDEFSNNYDIRKFNESWDATSQIRDYALPDHIYDNENLFENYFDAMIGGLSSDQESMGRKSYERIANFTQNHVDVDTCGIDQLYALAEELDVPFDKYNLKFPPSLKRLMEIVSIGHQRLWGTRCKCQNNFKPAARCTVCAHSHCLNRSKTALDTTTLEVSSGNKFVIKPIFGPESYEVIETVNTSPLSSIESISWLNSANYDDYIWYNYIDTFCDVQVEGVINWDDTYTTLSENTSSLSGWYDENEIVDVILNYDLHQGLSFNLE